MKQYTADEVAQCGCIVCVRLGYGESPAEVHHIRAGMGVAMRNDDQHAIPLCPAHHRTGGHGIALHAGIRTFEAQYGSEEELLAATHELIDRRRKNIV